MKETEILYRVIQDDTMQKQHNIVSKKLGDTMKNKFSNTPNSRLITLINEWVKSDRNRRLMKRRLIDGYTLEKLAEEFDISITRTRQIISESEKLLEIAIKKT